MALLGSTTIVAVQHERASQDGQGHLRRSCVTSSAGPPTPHVQYGKASPRRWPCPYDGREVRGALNLYSTTTEDIDLDAPDIASLFATQVALALGWARTENHLNMALSSRKEIGQAIGLVMERYQINEVKAFAFLLRLSSNGNIKIRDVAHELVAQSDTRYTIKDS